MKKVKSIKRKSVITMAIAAICALSGCAQTEIEYEVSETDTYTNHIEIEGQWGSSSATGEDGQYGIGDPFVMRWNGKYCLYPSTSDPCSGIKVFESDDLIHWTYQGYAVSEDEITSHGAYAPEVVYYNGYFYLCQSRAGEGHYIYRSTSPTEGFELVSKTENGDEGELNYGNLGMGIDGSFYVSDDGKLYLLHTSTSSGLKYNQITDVDNIVSSTLGATGTLGEANLGGWIEGPGIFRRGDYSYLTYTGNHVLSKGYRVAYSYAKDLGNLSSFTQPTDNVTLIDTDEDHYGLGHSSNVIGPDLDSIYTAYHNYVGSGPARRYNVDRYFACGSILVANGVTHRAVSVPSSPTAEAYGEDLTASGGYYVLGETDGYFTAEFNVTPVYGQAVFFGKSDGGYYEIRYTDSGLALYSISSSKETLIAEGSAVYSSDSLNTIRIENGDGVGYIYLNGMRIISYEAESAEGKIGCLQKDGVGYVAFTNDVFGTSDFEAVKNFPTKFPATAYLKGENRGFSISKAKQVQGGVRVGEKQNITQYGDEFAVSLSKNDWVKYAVDVPSDDTYSVSALVSRASAGAKLKITVGSSELICTIPETGSGDSDTVKVSLGRIRAEEGITTMRVEVTSGSADFVTFEVYENASDPGQASLADFTIERGDVTYADGTLSITGVNGGSVALWGNAGVCNFETEITFSCNADVSTEMGVMLRASNYSYYSSQATPSWQGYYLQLSSQLMELDRCNYGGNYLSALRISNIGDGNAHTLKVTAESNRITVTLDGNYSFTAEDDCAFLNGRIGFYVSSGEMKILSFSYKTI